jgi:hypothetical protein
MTGSAPCDGLTLAADTTIDLKGTSTGKVGSIKLKQDINIESRSGSILFADDTTSIIKTGNTSGGVSAKDIIGTFSGTQPSSTAFVPNLAAQQIKAEGTAASGQPGFLVKLYGGNIAGIYMRVERPPPNGAAALGDVNLNSETPCTVRS